MRFTRENELPEPEHVYKEKEVIEVCNYFRDVYDEGGLIGFDTETSGLEHGGLGTDLLYFCLADDKRRIAIPTWGSYDVNFDPVTDMLLETQEALCCYNGKFDFNVVWGSSQHQFGWNNPPNFETFYADGMVLYCRFDEEGLETGGERGLKARASQFLNLPMNSFDKILIQGGILNSLKENPSMTIEYCTRDAWAHLGVVSIGSSIAEQIPWAKLCPSCDSFVFREYRYHDEWECFQCGRFDDRQGKDLTMLDWHFMKDVPLLIELHKMERRGLPIDWEYLEDLSPKMGRMINQIHRDFNREVKEAQEKADIPQRSVSISSTQQLQRFYHGDKEHGEKVGINLPVQSYTDSGNASLGVDELKKLQVLYDPPGIEPLLKHREVSKIHSTYVEGILEKRNPMTNRLHGGMSPTTKTGRLSSSNPNLQNQPAGSIVFTVPPASKPPSFEHLMNTLGSEEEARKFLNRPEYKSVEVEANVRRAFKAPPGYKLICADYAQLEVRITAIASQDDQLISVINEGTDMHCYTASRAFTSSLGLLGYDDLYEMKQWSEGNPSPRMDTLKKIKKGDFDEKWLHQKISTSGVRPDEFIEKVSNLPDAFSDMSYEDMVDYDEELSEDLIEIIGCRDKPLKNLRSSAKATIFGIIYGIGSLGLAVQITEATGNRCTKEEARDLIDSIKYDIFPGIGEMLEAFKWSARSRGFVRTLMNRPRHPKGAISGNHRKRARAMRQSMNSPIQGTASDIVCAAMQEIGRDPICEDLGVEMLVQVHDEILSLIPEERAEEGLHRKMLIMEQGHQLVTPVTLEVTGDVADTWDQAK